MNPYAHQSDRLGYRPVAETDIPHLHTALTDPRVIEYMSIRFTTQEPGREQWDWYQSQLSAGTALFLSVFRQSDHAFCGVCSLYYYDAGNCHAELGYWLLPEYWGMGYALEACKVTLAAARQQWPELHRVEAIIESEHGASRKVLEKCGFALEGVLREAELKQGKWIDLEVWAGVVDGR